MLKDTFREACKCCGYRGHDFARCKYVFYIPNHKQLICEFNTSEPNEREPYFREERRRNINAFLNKNLICITAISFAITNKL